MSPRRLQSQRLRVVPRMKSPKQHRLRQRVPAKLRNRPRKLATGISSQECLALAVKKRLSKPVYLLMRRRPKQLLRVRRSNRILSQRQAARHSSQSPNLKQKRLKQKSPVSLSRFFRLPIPAKKRRPNLHPSQRLLRRQPKPQTIPSQHQQTQQTI